MSTGPWVTSNVVAPRIDLKVSLQRITGLLKHKNFWFYTYSGANFYLIVSYTATSYPVNTLRVASTNGYQAPGKQVEAQLPDSLTSFSPHWILPLLPAVRPPRRK